MLREHARDALISPGGAGVSPPQHTHIGSHTLARQPLLNCCHARIHALGPGCALTAPALVPRGVRRHGVGMGCGACGKAAARFTEALNRGEAAGLIHELKLNPTGLGVEPFLIALQASADASNAAGTSSTAGTRSRSRAQPHSHPSA